MKLTSRVLLGTLAMAAAVSGNVASAHADATSAGSGSGSGSGNAGVSSSGGVSGKAGSNSSTEDTGPSTTDALLCPFVTSGPLNAVLNDLNPQSVAGACGGPGTNLVTGNNATGNQAPAIQPAAAATRH